MSPVTVYFGSPRQHRLDPSETLPAKLDLILERLHLRERVEGEQVAIKIHSGSNIGYSTLHPVFLRKVVKAIKDGGGKPFIADISHDVADAEARGYTAEVLGCPIYPAAGPNERHYYVHHRPFKCLQDWKLAGMIEEASFLVNFAHVKGHPACGFGGAFKNLALGCMIGETRALLHDTFHFDPYWFPEKCPDMAVRQQIMEACPRQALVPDKVSPGDIHLRGELCNSCMRCQAVAPAGSLKILPDNFFAFQEACAISTQLVLDTFAPGKAVHLALATQQTPVCDCFGFTGMAVLPDAGIFGSDDIVALDQAVLDVTGKTALIEDAIPTSMEIVTREGHPWQQLHGKYKDPYQVVRYGEALGLGSSDYELVDVLPLDVSAPAEVKPISAR